MRRPSHRLAFTLVVAGLLSLAYWVFRDAEILNYFIDIELLVSSIRDLGTLGPLLVIGLMAIAIVFNPLPSAPIALAAGAIYGHTYGTIYIVLGALLGALVAFGVARWAGYDFTRRFFEDAGRLQRIGSQNLLTALVFVSRLIPFMSFDLISYAAGLSPIHWWRFALATLFGLIPMSFILAHFGSEMREGDIQSATLAVLVLGLLTLTPLLVRMLRARAVIRADIAEVDQSRKD